MNAHDLRVEEAATPYLFAPLLTDHLDTFASTPEGFKRLRELVLDLAVRGSLVVQSKNDEPAEKLLTRIADEKATLRIPPPSDCKTDALYNLPKGWAWTTLGEVATRIQYGYTASADHNIATPKLLRITDIQNDQVVWGNVPGVATNGQNISPYLLKPGDLLIARTGGTIGKSFLVGTLPVECVFASYLIRVALPRHVDPKFVKVFASSGIYWKQLIEKSAGTGQPNVNGTALSSLAVPIPPLVEQSRIVAKVEELMALISTLEAKVGAGETARGRLLDARLAALADSPDAAATADAWAQLAPHFDLLLQSPADVDRLQQTLLQLAVKGRLVPQNPKDEPAAELLKRIRAEKGRLVAESKIKREKPLPAIDEDELPYMLPESWHWSRLGSVGDSFDYGTSQKATETPRGVPVLRMGNVQAGTVTLTNLKYFEDGQGELPHLYLQPGDLLFNRTNSYELVGKTGIFEGEPHRYSFASYLIRVRANTRAIFPQYLNLYMNSRDCRLTQIEPQIVQQNGQANFNGTKLQAICVPLPPLAEQSRIVAAVASLTALCGHLRERLATRRELSAKLAAALTESVLA